MTDENGNTDSDAATLTDDSPDTDSPEPVKKKAKKKVSRAVSGLYINASNANIFTADGRVPPGTQCRLTPETAKAFGGKVQKV